MFTVYAYVLDTMADWETGYAVAELHSGRFFRKDAPLVSLRTAGCSLEPVSTMGGLKIIPDVAIGDIAAGESVVLLLPGADAWGDPKHAAAVGKAREILRAGGTVCAICGATVALAGAGLLDDRRHTSNGPGFLEMMVPSYAGQRFYADESAVADESSANGTLITASATGALAWAKQILARLDVFAPEALEAWHAYFSTGSSDQFFALMQAVQAGK